MSNLQTQIRDDMKTAMKAHDKQRTGTLRMFLAALTADTAALQEKLTALFNNKVEMTCSANGKGKITIPFGSEEELERIMSVFDKMN